MRITYAGSLAVALSSSEPVALTSCEEDLLEGDFGGLTGGTPLSGERVPSLAEGREDETEGERSCRDS